MTAQTINGKKIAQELLLEIKEKASHYRNTHGRSPCLAVILVGNNPASEIYVARKKEAAHLVGIDSPSYHLKDNCSEVELKTLIEKLNQDKNMDGILLQLPLPAQIDTDHILDLIKPLKDVDGFHALNIGRLVQQRPLLRPCTPLAVMRLLEKTNIPLEGQHAVVVGASNVVGKPMGLELLLAGCTVTTCHSKTRDLAHYVKQADIVVSAVGQPNLIKGEWIKDNAIVIDIGITRLENGKLAGDVEYEKAKLKASWITPVPGGVGPMTVAVLMENTLIAATTANKE